MNKTFDEFKKETIAEIEFLRANLTEDQKVRYDKEKFNPNDGFQCIYGQPFRAEMSIDELHKFYPRTYDNIHFEKIPDGVDEHSFEAQDMSYGEYYSALEKYTSMHVNNPEHNHDIIDYIQGYTETCPVTYDPKGVPARKVYLLLDDTRNQNEVYRLMNYNVYKDVQWVVVRSHIEFMQYINTNPLPYMISFDHDLKQEHYTPEKYWTDYHASAEYQEEQGHTETGFDSAVYLAEKCKAEGLKLPKFLVHSANPCGRDRITQVLMNAKDGIY